MTTRHKKPKPEAKAMKATEAALRDQFAMAALPTLCHHTIDEEGAAADVAMRAYLVADAMLAAREPHEDEAAPSA